MEEWILPAVLSVCFAIGWIAYVYREERLSRIRFSDDQHENGPFGQ